MTSSLDNKYSRYIQGGTTAAGTIGLGWWERKIFAKDPSDQVYYVENRLEHRIDLIAHEFFGDSRLWWVIAQYNDLLDPHSEIVAGRMLVIPTKSRLYTELLVNNV